MRLILSEYLRTLRERDEFDRLLPDLLLAMGYVPVAKPQTGVRQYGVDFAAVGKSADGVDEMLLFVIKRGDIGRREWDNGEPTSVRPSINEVLDMYLPKLVAPEHADLQKTIVLATTGDLKQDIEAVWNSYKEQNGAKARFDFWGGDRVADLLERHLLDENLFAAEDRADLRKALALAGENEYDFRDLKRLLLRQLGLQSDGTLSQPPADARLLRRALRRVHLASQVCARWAQAEGDTRQALWVNERMLLWGWHRAQLLDNPAQVDKEIGDLWQSYVNAALEYVEAMSPHFQVRDGMSGYCRESSEFALVVYEHIGLLASVGLACLLQEASNNEQAAVMRANLEAISEALSALLSNNPASGSPRLDEHAIEISLGLFFLAGAERWEDARRWLGPLAQRLDYTFRMKDKFPVSTDSVEDLVALEVAPNDDPLRDRLMQESWCLATIAAWCAVLRVEDGYALLARGAANSYGHVIGQLWHPRADWPALWYFGGALDAGDSEAPYQIPWDIAELKKRIALFLKREEYDWGKDSATRRAGFWGLDFIACRHLRMPVPASIWYRLMRLEESDATDAQSA